ncbi:flagellar basal body P-ring protein FlgI [Aurantivibrio plasticivorans]
MAFLSFSKWFSVSRLMLCGVTMIVSSFSFAERIKDISSIAGVRPNQLIGYGLVVGLDGTGDQTNQTPFTTQSFMSMMESFGVTVPSGIRMQLKNVAAVTIHAELPAFSKQGQTIDVTVSSIGNAKSLRGGTLLMAPLKGIDGNVYAIAQGSLVVGGLGVEGADGSKVTINVPSVGRIPNGAIVERVVGNAFNSGKPVVFNLHRPDFTTAKRVADSINRTLGPDVARSIDAVSIKVDAPVNPDERVGFLSLLENIEVTPGEEAARVVINSRTGTIVVGQHVRVSPVAVTHGNLTVTVSEEYEVSQPGGDFNRVGETVTVPRSDITVDGGASPMFKLNGATTLDDIVKAVNTVGAAPGDLMAIIEALKQSGALRAELVVL